MLGVERRQKIMEKLQLEQKVYVSELSKGITDKTDPQIGVDFFVRTRRQTQGLCGGFVDEDRGKRYTKVAVLNLSAILLSITNPPPQSCGGGLFVRI